jgi:hypothetical protein
MAGRNSDPKKKDLQCFPISILERLDVEVHRCGRLFYSSIVVGSNFKLRCSFSLWLMNLVHVNQMGFDSC